MNRIPVLYAIFILGLAGAGVAASLQNHGSVVMMDDVALGMTESEVLAVKKQARKLSVSVGSYNTNAVIYTEIDKSTRNAIFTHYHFLDGQLRAVTYGYGRNRDQKIVTDVMNKLTRDYVRQPDQAILRIDENLNKISANTELWTGRDGTQSVYFVDSSNEVTIIAFDPNYFSKNDFFLNPSESSKIDPSLEAAKRSLEKAESIRNANKESRNP